MKYSHEIKKGFTWSFLSPAISTLILSIVGGTSEAIEHSIAAGIESLFTMLPLFGFTSMIVSGFFCAVLGIPLYLLLRTLGYANAIVLTLLGTLAGWIIGTWYSPTMGLQVFFAAHGAATAYCFWLGSTKVAKSIAPH